MVNYNDMTVSAVPLPDEAALEEFGFDPDAWRTGHSPMPAGTLYYANALLRDAYTIELTHASPKGHAVFCYDFSAGKLTVEEIKLSDAAL